MLMGEGESALSLWFPNSLAKSVSYIISIDTVPRFSTEKTLPVAKDGTQQQAALDPHRILVGGRFGRCFVLTVHQQVKIT
jgi:hypothetical protein